MNAALAEKLEVFLMLAARRETFADAPENLGNAENPENVEDIENIENADDAERGDAAGAGEFSEKIFAALEAQMSAEEIEIFERMRAVYRQKSAAEKANWQSGVRDFIGTDETFLDPHVHRSHIDRALDAETAAIRAIVAAAASERPNHDGRKQENTNGENARRRADALEKAVRRAFAAQFVAQRNLPAPTAFDRLSGAQTARLIRLAGIREVALACVRIDAVESVASFLRRFSAGDARAIAAQLSGLPPTSAERLLFAENLVQAALESGLQPAAMLDLLGFRLIGIALCAAAPERVRHAEQKLPLEVEPKLSAVIDAECRATPVAMQREIERQIENLAEIAAQTSEKIGA